MMIKWFCCLAMFICFCGCTNDSTKNKNKTDKETLKVFSTINDSVYLELFELFEKETGIAIELEYVDNKETFELLENELEGDAFIGGDIGILQYVVSLGYLEALKAEPIDENVPLVYRNRNRFWFGLGYYGLMIVFNQEKATKDDFNTYATLTKARWKGQMNLANVHKESTIGFLSAMISNKGEEQTALWLKGVDLNLNQQPNNSEKEQIDAIVKGLGTVTLTSSKSLGQYLAQNSNKTPKLGFSFPNQKTSGTHINLAGIGLLKTSKQKKKVEQFIAFLTDRRAQEMIANKLYVYPINPAVDKPDVLNEFGDFVQDQLDFNFLAKNRAKALDLLATVNW